MKGKSNTIRHWAVLRCHCVARCAASLGAALGFFAAGGCGIDPITALVGDGDAPRDSNAVRYVVVDWSGGESAILRGQELPGFNFDNFSVDDGDSLSEAEDDFRSRVLGEVSTILAEALGESVAVIDGEAAVADSVQAASTVVVAQITSSGDEQFGEAEYDPCDRFDGNSAVVFAEELRLAAGAMPLDDWVHVFANAISHEVAHNLGFGHVDREAFPPDARALYVELMLDRHTIAEMRQPQRMLADMSNCEE